MLSGASGRAPALCGRAAASLPRRLAPTRRPTADRLSPRPPELRIAATGLLHTTPPRGHPVPDPDAPKMKQPKVKRKEKKKSKKPDDGGDQAMIELLARAVDAKPKGPPPASEEEMARRHEIGRNYVIGMFNWENEINHDLNCKIQMKQHAIKMLPKRSMWKEEALKITMDGPPYHRDIPKETPPIPGFDPTQFIKEDD